jgi:hypothetical protein
LVDSGLLVKGEYNKENYDKTNWYSPEISAKWIENPIGQKSPMDWSETANGLVKNRQPIPDIKPVDKPVVKKLKQKKSEIDYQSVVDAWNEKAEKHKMPKVQLLTEPRKTAIKARVADIGGVDNLIEAIERVFLSNFLTGQTDRPFKASFDWATKSSNFIKIVEGNYDNEKSTNNRNSGNPRAMGNTSKTAEIADFAAKYAARRAANSGNGGAS